MTTFFQKGFGVFVPVLSLFVAACQSTKVETKVAETKVAETTNSVVAAPMPLAIMHGPLLQAPSETGITISWGTSRKCVSWVEYRAEASKEWVTNTPVRHGLVEADVTHHNVTLTGLEPGTRYIYRVVSKEIADFKYYKVVFGGMVLSAEHRFTTLNTRKPAFSFVVLNDRHEKVGPLTNSLASINWTNVDLAILNGDMVHGVNDLEQMYRCVVDPCTESFGSRIPLVYVRGNHDARGTFARRLLDYFPTDSGRYYYTLQHGPVSFLVLDCGEDKTDASVEYNGLVNFEPYMRKQVEWLAQAIKEPAWRNSQFRVCLLHLPPMKKPDPKFIRPQWLLDNVVPLLNEGKVDLLMSAHTHKYAIQGAGTNGMNFPMIIGGTETVIRCDVTRDRINVRTSDLLGKPLPQLPAVEARRRD